MAQVPLREHYASDEEYQAELDIYLTNLDSDVENLTAGSSDVAVVKDNQDRPVIGGIVQAYQERYLLTRYATAPDGSVGFTPDYSTVVGLTVYQGLRESATPTESTNPADYTWRELSVTSGWTPSFRTLGGRQVDWMFGSSVPSGYTEDTASAVVDLDSLPGAVGADGNSVGTVVAFIRSANDITSTTPAATTYNTTTGDFAAPTGYSKVIPQMPVGVDIYATYATVFGSGTVALSWGSPSLYGQAGENGLNTRIDFAYATNVTGTTGFSTSDSTLGFRGTNAVSWREGETVPTQSTTPGDYEWAQWTGNTGNNGQAVDIYRAWSNSADGSTAFSTTYFADALYEGTDVVTWTPPTSKPTQSQAASSYEWTRIRGEDGNSVTGATGPRRENGFIYDARTNAGSTPSGGSINWTTGVLTPPSGWSNTGPSTVPNGEQVYVSYWAAAEATFDGTTNITYTIPVLAETVVNDVRSTNFTSGSSGYFLDASAGSAEFQNITARGAITATSLSLGNGVTIPNSSVSGLGTAAVAATGDFATAAQGTEADSAIQPDETTSLTAAGNLQSTGFNSGSAGWRIRGNGDAEFQNATVRGAITATSLTLGSGVTIANTDVSGLGTASTAATGDFATSAQGDEADSAMQPDESTSLTAAGNIQSSDFATGSAGWQIRGNGNAEFNNVTVRGDIESSEYDGATSFTTASTVANIGTKGYFLDSSSGIIAINDIIARDFDVSGSNLRLGLRSGNPSSISGDDNISMGEDAGSSLTSGTDNISIGWLSGNNITTGDRNISIGRTSGTAVIGEDNNISIGHGVGPEPFEANRINIGNTSHTDTNFRTNNFSIIGNESPSNTTLRFVDTEYSNSLSASGVVGRHYTTSGFDVFETDFTFSDRGPANGYRFNVVRSEGSSNTTEFTGGSISFGEDNIMDVGTSSRRFNDVFATNGITTTSDEAEKQQVTTLSPAEISAANHINVIKYKWNKAVELKGEDARWHTGVIAQEVVNAFSAEGLNAFDYGLVGRDNINVDIDTDESLDGAPIWRYNVRYNELQMFLYAAQKQRQDALEARIAALEV